MTRIKLLDKPVWAVALTCGVAALLATGGAYVGMVAPVRQSEAAAAESRVRLDEADAQAARLERDAAAMSARLAASEAELADMPIKLGDVSDLNQRIADLIRLAQEAGLEVGALQPGERKDHEHYRVVSLRLEAGGAFDRQLAFLDRVHAVYPDVRVADVRLEAQARAAEPRPQTTVELRWFTALDPQASEPGR